MKNNNLELWENVEKTNPNYTKQANVKGNKITSISPQYQIKQATEQFGVYGVTWGFKSMQFDYTLKDIGMATFKAVFFFPNGQFEIVNSVQLFKDGAKTKIDDDFAKKVETDTLTKALSKLGFSADIFLGKFDDVKYLNEVKEEFKPKPPLSNDAFNRLLGNTLTVINNNKDNYALTTEQKTLLNAKIKELEAKK